LVTADFLQSEVRHQGTEQKKNQKYFATTYRVFPVKYKINVKTLKHSFSLKKRFCL